MLGSARASRAGFGASPKRTCLILSRGKWMGTKCPMARRHRQHARRALSPNQTLIKPALLGATLLLIQIVLLQEFGPELLWRSGNIWPPLRREVHEIPIRPHRVDMIHRRFSPPEMKNLSALPPEYM